MDNIIILIVIISSIWVYFDAKKIGVKKGLTDGIFNMGPIAWALCCILLWIIAFPAYIVNRPKIIAAAQEQGGPDSAIEITQSGLNTFAKYVVMTWTLICSIGLGFGLSEMSSVPIDHSNEYEMAGAAIGTTLGMGMWLVFWAVITVPATIVYFITKRSEPVVVVEKQHTPPGQPNQKSDESKKCPYCAETIKKDAIFCRFCKNDLNDNIPHPEPEQTDNTKPTPDWKQRGKDLIKREEYKEAIIALSYALKNDPTGESNYLRAIAYSKVKSKDKMITDLEAAAGLGYNKARNSLEEIENKRNP